MLFLQNTLQLILPLFNVQLSVMRTDARRLRSACDKTATREWKQRKNLLNKTILSKLMVSLFNAPLKEFYGMTPGPQKN